MLPVVLLASLCCLLFAGLLWSLRRRGTDAVVDRWADQRAANERLEQLLRDEMRLTRHDQIEAQSQAQTQLNAAAHALAGEQHRRLEAFAARLEQMNERFERSQLALRDGLAEAARKSRQEQAEAQQVLGRQIAEQLQALIRATEQRQADLRATLDARLQAMQTDNAAKLDQMRATVDEKLQSTLEKRLGQSFTLVSERLEAVQRGLGEMRELAAGVGDLKRVLGNVKTRGTFGEVQLGTLLDQLLVPEQYEANIATVPQSADRVEFAIRLPGPDGDRPVWLPIDAKFPREDYERLLDAQEHADADAAASAAAALERRIRDEAKAIRGKYVAPPNTTDFAILFLPTEGLYAEVIRRPGLFELVQREYHVTIAGPTTLTALLNSLQMGFRTLAIERRSSEVWQLLGAVKNEFGKFSGILDSAVKQVDTVRRTLKKASGKSTTITRKLRGVESLGAPDEDPLLGLDGEDGVGGDDDDPPPA